MYIVKVTHDNSQTPFINYQIMSIYRLIYGRIFSISINNNEQKQGYHLIALYYIIVCMYIFTITLSL